MPYEAGEMQGEKCRPTCLGARLQEKAGFSHCTILMFLSFRCSRASLPPRNVELHGTRPNHLDTSPESLK